MTKNPNATDVHVGKRMRMRRLRNNTARQLMIIGRKIRHFGQRPAAVAKMQ